MKSTEKKIFYTPENIDGACMTGRLMTPEEAKYMSEWVAKSKSEQLLKTRNPKSKVLG